MMLLQSQAVCGRFLQRCGCCLRCPQRILFWSLSVACRGSGVCYPAVKNGKSSVRGILLTTEQIERVVERVRPVCGEHFLPCKIEKSWTHLSVVVGGEEGFQPKRELLLFTSRFGDFAGIKFSIELGEPWQRQSEPLV